MKVPLTLVASFLLGSTVFAWNDTGHMVVGRIAELTMTEHARKLANALLEIGADDRTNSIPTATCYADDTKSDFDRAWHYKDRHFWDDNRPTENKAEDENAVWAVNRFTKVLKDKSASADDRASALLYILHLVGDLHQPLHAIARDSDEHPQGDRGGNDFKIKPITDWSDRPINNLHAAWDFGLGEFKAVLARPFSNNSAYTLDRQARALMKEFPKSKFSKISDLNPDHWHAESFGYHQFVYSIKEKQPLPDDYQKRGRRLCRERVTLAGYRLGMLLNQLLDQ